MSSILNNIKAAVADPIRRPHSPYSNPSALGAHSRPQIFLTLDHQSLRTRPSISRRTLLTSANKGPRSQQLARGDSNFHSTSLRTMVSNTVNKTSLHPGGVQ